MLLPQGAKAMLRAGRACIGRDQGQLFTGDSVLLMDHAQLESLLSAVTLLRMLWWHVCHV